MSTSGKGNAQERKIFLLSPAQCGGKRAALLFNDRAAFELARHIRRPEGAPLGEVFSFLSGLYFRGKLAYARAFARPPRGNAGVLVITPNRGLVNPGDRLGLDGLRALAEVPISMSEPRYHEPLRRDVQQVARSLGRKTEVVFLGSVATRKYLDILLESLEGRLVVPADFPGRGDMSRGGLLLRAVRQQTELAYVPAAAVVRGTGAKSDGYGQKSQIGRPEKGSAAV